MPAPSASASTAGNDFTRRARERHFQEELARAQARWQTGPGLATCATALKDKADLELCQAAASALAAISEPAATPELAITRLAPGALAFARLSERVRYLSLAELGQKHVQADAGVAPATSASVAALQGAPAAAVSHVRKGQRSGNAEQRAIELGDGPISQLMPVTIGLERDAVRNLGAYLEYGPLPVRRAAFDAVNSLRVQHPQWPSLERLLQEAALLELDGDLKRDLRQLSASGLPQRSPPR